MKNFLKIFSFLPALAMMYLIFNMSAQDGVSSASLSIKVAEKAVVIYDKVFDANLSDEQLAHYAQVIHTPIRKLGHMTEYFLLAVTVSFPLYVYGMRGIWLMFFAGVICVGFACGDEYHQSFVAGRGPSKRDVLIDSIGVFFGIMVVRIVCWCAIQAAKNRSRSD